MRNFVKKILCIVLSLGISVVPLYAAEKVNTVGTIAHEFSLTDVPEVVIFKTKEEITPTEGIIIPAESKIEAELLQAEQERRWHKSGVMVCKMKNYTPEFEESAIDISEKNIYFLARKYEALDKKDAAILSTEIVLTQAAGIVGSCFIIFAPVDIAYFFAKGAIQRENHPNWFKSGVSCAYDNSIFWFWLKGKSIELREDETVKIKTIKPQKAVKLSENMLKRNCKRTFKHDKKEIKKYKKEFNKAEIKKYGKVYIETDKYIKKSKIYEPCNNLKL